MVLVLNSCNTTNPPFLADMSIEADSLMNKALPENYDYLHNNGIKLDAGQSYKLFSDSTSSNRIISWKKIGDNYLVFFEDIGLQSFLFDKDGNILDRCKELLYNSRVIFAREYYEDHDAGDSDYYGNYHVVTKWKSKYVGEDKFEITQIINDTMIINRLYEVSDKITMISRTSSTGTLTPSMDVITLPFSQTYAACDFLTKYKDLHFIYEDIIANTTFSGRYSLLYSRVLDNPQEVFRWICEHKNDKIVQNLLLKCYLRTKFLKVQDEKYYKNYRMPDYEFLHKNILEVKDKANQEYLLNMLKQFKKEYDNYKPQKVYATL